MTAQRNRALFVRPVTCELSHTLPTQRVHLCARACTCTREGIYIIARVTKREASLAPTASRSLIIGIKKNNEIKRSDRIKKKLVKTRQELLIYMDEKDVPERICLNSFWNYFSYAYIEKKI